MDKIALIASLSAGIYLIIVLIFETICGFIAQGIARKRGLKDNGFCWGFFLSILGIIIMRCCPKE